MSDPFSDLVKQLSSKGDWAVALPAALVGFVADATLHLVPSGTFSPPECGLIAGFGALSGKRIVEAFRQRQVDRQRLHRAAAEAMTVVDQLEAAGKTVAAGELRFEATMTDDVAALILAIRRARAEL